MYTLFGSIRVAVGRSAAVHALTARIGRALDGAELGTLRGTACANPAMEGAAQDGRYRHLRGLWSIYPDIAIGLFARVVHHIMPIFVLPVGLVARRHGVVDICLLCHFLLFVCPGLGFATCKLRPLGFHQCLHVERAIVVEMCF